MATQKAKYHSVEDGEWIAPNHRGMLLSCCDCSLTHRIDFRIVRGRVQMRLQRDSRATANMRRPAEKTRKSIATRVRSLEKRYYK